MRGVQARSTDREEVMKGRIRVGLTDRTEPFTEIYHKINQKTEKTKKVFIYLPKITMKWM